MPLPDLVYGPNNLKPLTLTLMQALRQAFGRRALATV